MLFTMLLLHMTGIGSVRPYILWAFHFEHNKSYMKSARIHNNVGIRYISVLAKAQPEPETE